jgi:FAD:protein FMN transferase
MLALFCASCVSTQTQIITLNRYEFDRTEWGAPFRIVLYAPNPLIASNAAAAAFQRIKQLNDIMTDDDSESELSKLSLTSGQGQPVHVSHDLWMVLQRAQSLAERSGGAFDVTVGPYVNLWRQARRQGTEPDPARLAKARLSVGYKHVLLDATNQTVTLLAPNMRLDLDGIARGYAVDQALHILSRIGLGNALVSSGGDFAVSGPPPGKRGWLVELPSWDATNAPADRFVLLDHAGLSTSSDLLQRLEINGKCYPDTIDPRTGMCLTDHSLVTVIAPDDCTADSLTKVMSVLSPKEALRFIRGMPGVAARIVRQPGGTIEQYESKQFHHYYQ